MPAYTLEQMNAAEKAYQDAMVERRAADKALQYACMPRPVDDRGQRALREHVCSALDARYAADIRELQAFNLYHEVRNNYLGLDPEDD